MTDQALHSPAKKSMVNSLFQAIPLLILLLTSFLFHQLLDYTWLRALAYGLLAWQITEFLILLGTRIGILNIIPLLASVQWICMPVAVNDFFGTNIIAVKEDAYLSFVIPGFLLLWLGINWFNYRLEGSEKALIEKASKQLASTPQLGVYLFVIGFIGGLAKTVVPVQLAFLLYLINHLMFVGAIYMIFSPSKNKVLVVGLVLFLTLSEVAATGMFGEFVYWTGLMFIVLAVNFRIRMVTKVLVFLLGITMVFTIQAVKWDFRAQTWEHEVENSGQVLFQTFVQRVTNPETLLSPEALYGLLERGNMGFHIGRTLNHVPKKEPYADGETILAATVGSFIPRLLWPDKPISGGKEKMRRFAGYKTRGNTSMNIGPLAEGYANFGKVGGWVYIFFYGLFFGWLFMKILQLAQTYPTLIFWLPFIFLQVVKVETDLTTVLNHALKASFFTWLVFWIGANFFKIKL